MSQAVTQKRIKWIELAQIISMVCVVFHHSTPNFTTVNHVVEAFSNTIQFPALCIFFFCSGFLASNWTRTSYKTYVKKRFVRLLIPWITVSLLMFLPKVLLASAELRERMLQFDYLILCFADPHGHGILPHLWYLPTLFILSISVSIIDRCFKTIPSDLFILLVTFAFACFPGRITNFFCLNEARLYAFWFMAGYLSNRFTVCLKGIWKERSILSVFALVSFSGCLLIVFLARDFAFSRILISVVGFICIISSSFLFQDKFEQCLAFFRGKLLCIYIWSLCAQNFIEVLAKKMNLNGNMTFIVMFFCGLIIPCLIWHTTRFVEKKSNKKLPAIHIVLGI